MYYINITLCIVYIYIYIYNICINVFGYENKLVFPIHISEQKFEDSMDLLF